MQKLTKIKLIFNTKISLPNCPTDARKNPNMLVMKSTLSMVYSDASVIKRSEHSHSETSALSIHNYKTYEYKNPIYFTGVGREGLKLKRMHIQTQTAR